MGALGRLVPAHSRSVSDASVIPRDLPVFEGYRLALHLFRRFGGPKFNGFSFGNFVAPEHAILGRPHEGAYVCACATAFVHDK
jgi:hypothetical protein